MNILKKKPDAPVDEQPKDVAPSEFAAAKASHSSGTMRGFIVEARHNFSSPQQIGDQIFDNRWRTVRFEKGPPGFGVPTADWELVATGMYSWAAAQALRWWFHANANLNIAGICLETRIVEQQIKYSLEWKPVAAHSEIGVDGFSAQRPVPH